VGQTGRSFRIRHQEHLNDIKYNRDKTGYSQHILNTQHDFSKDTALEVFEVHSKTPFLNILEKFHIYKHKKTGVIFNEQIFYSYNPIFLIL
jgi:hypothetical protein